jgi:hypothetical protein
MSWEAGWSQKGKWNLLPVWSELQEEGNRTELKRVFLCWSVSLSIPTKHTFWWLGKQKKPKYKQNVITDWVKIKENKKPGGIGQELVL